MSSVVSMNMGGWLAQHFWIILHLQMKIRQSQTQNMSLQGNLKMKYSPLSVNVCLTYTASLMKEH